MKGFRLIFTLLIAGTFAFGAIACDKPAEEAKPEAPTEEKKDEAKPAEEKKDEAKPAEEKKDEAKPAEGGTNAAKPAEGASNGAAAEGEKKDEPKGGAESQ